jgi:multiple sugar transport system permease protein/raffinose/stachyose/melibiose transport system permease protein
VSANALAAPRAAASRRLRRPWAAIVVFLAPALVFYAAFVVVPVLMTFYNSVHRLEIYGSVTQYTWVGFQHYERLIPQVDGLGLYWQDATFKLAVQHSLTWAAVSPFLEIPIAMVLAYALYLGVPGVRFFRFAWFAPVLISWIVVGIIFKWVFNYEWGAVNVFLRSVGLTPLATNWLGNTSTALPALIAMTTWKQVGFNMVILLAAISAVPRELIDAARIDGAGRARILWSVIVPMVRVTVVNLLVLCFMGKMEAFAAVWVTTQGGPVYSTETVATYMQKRAFLWQTFDLGYPSAMAVIWCVLVLGLALFFQRVLQKRQIVEF